jgi:hypothetical protein
MSERPTIETAELGHRFDLTELARCIAIYGAVAWPGKRPGFAVIIGMIYTKMYLLTEYESEDIRELVYKCGELSSDFCFSLDRDTRRWYRNYDNPNATDFVQEMNRENKDCPFSFYGSSNLSERDEPYGYLLPKLKGEYLKPEKKRLFLKGSKVREYLDSIENPNEPPIKLGDYPAIEAVAIAAIELQREADRLDNHAANTPHKSAYNNNVLTRGLGNKRK